MKTFLNDFEEINLSSLEETHKFITEREATDVWTYPYINELKAVGIPLDSPILIAGLKNSIPNLIADEKQISEAMSPEYGEMSLLLEAPNTTGGSSTFPMRYTAINSLLERAGLGGRSIRNVECKDSYKALDPTIKAEFISTCLSLYKDNCKMLFRDGKIATVRSSKYEVLKASNLIEELEANIDLNWSGYHFDSGVINHEYTMINYILDDAAAESTIRDLLAKTAYAGRDVKIGLTFSTSDVGNSIAKVTSFINILDDDGKPTIKIPFGNEKGMKHSTGASMEKWSNHILPQLVPLVSEMEALINAMVDVKIKNPGGCLRHLAMTLKLPKAISLEAADTFDSMFNSCSAFDVFSELTNIVCEFERQALSKGGNVSPSNKLRYSDIVASSVFINFKEHDYDFEWE